MRSSRPFAAARGAALALACAAALGATAAAADDAAPGLPDARWRPFQTGMLRADRLQHASLAFTSGVGAGLATRSPEAAFATAATLGLAKEWIDVRDTHFDWVDLAADLAGAAAAALAIRAIER